MVGLFHLGNKSSSPSRNAAISPELPTSDSLDSLPPPPPYKDVAAPPLVMREVTTTTTEVITTTQTTTHFFSLPLWRKRGAPASAHTSSYMPADESGIISRPGMSSHLSFLEKALPPTPPDEPQPYTTQLDGRASRSRDTLQPAIADDPGRSRPSSPGQHPLEPRTSTAALAHAALGIGLPAVFPQVTTSSSTPTVITSHNPSNVTPSNNLRANVRRAKSTRALAQERTIPDPAYASDGETSPRTRSTSFTMSSYLSSASDVKGKGKARADMDGESPIARPKTISRRPSFWSRKKSVPTPPKKPTALEHVRNEASSPTLPSLPPLSPFLVGSRMTSSPEPHDRTDHAHSAGSLIGQQRRRSISLTPPMPETSTKRRVASPPTRSRRPMTADSSASTSPTRASFFIPPSPELSPLPSPSVEKPPEFPFPLGTRATAQRRPRAQTNPPILHRLSLNLFSLSSASPSPSQSHSSPLASARASPRPSLATRPVNIPKPHGGEESPEVYLTRLRAAVSKAEIAGLLALSSDPFHVRALQAYIDEFDFTADPLDVALRKLLMDVGLPRETQQIDRVIEAFATRYKHCNPDLYTSEGRINLIMLHTDAFNKSNKRKMTKADYVKNTRLPGVASEVLDCFYDNIIFAPFIFIEDPLDVNGQRGLIPDSTSSRLSASSLVTASTPINKSNKVDPYFLIINGLLDPLRVNVEAHIPTVNPYSYEGTEGPWKSDELRRAFARASVLEVGMADPLRPPPLFSLNVGTAPSPLLGNLAAVPEVFVPSTNEVWTLKVAKVALLNRKDILLPGGKKAMNRKWRPWSIILTGSQLLCFRDPSWATTLVAQFESSDGQTIYPHASIFRPDELYSVKDAVIVHDKSYTKHPYTLRLVMPDGRQFLLQAETVSDMNSWLSHINYASAFKSAGIRMRPLGMSTHDIQLAGVAAATSHLHEMQHKEAAPRQSGEAMLRASDPNGITVKSRPARSATLMSDRSDWDTDVPRAPEVEGADQLKATFDQVKAELATGQIGSPEQPSVQASTENPGILSRSQVIKSKIHDLESRLSVAQTQLDADLRFARNVAILAPFQKTTRDRLELAIRTISRRVIQVRLDIARLSCHKDVLSSDLVADMKDWQRTRLMAMKAASETIMSKTLPRMTLSYHDEEHTSTSPILMDAKANLSSNRPDSSACESFHSAIDFGPEWPSYDESGSQGLLGSRLFDSPRRNSSGSLQSFPFPDSESTNKSLPDPPSPAISDRNSPNIATPRSSTDTRNHEKFYTAQETLEEEAEDWDKTKCAQRVSLVRLPSDFRLSTLYDRYHSSLRS